MRSFILIGMICGLLVASTACIAQNCGDADSDGAVTIGDIVYMMNYMFGGGMPPGDFDVADFDGHQLLTINDAALLQSTAWSCDIIQPLCPPSEAPLEPVYDPDTWVMYPEFLPADSSKFTLPLTLECTDAVLGMCLPLEIRVDGLIPVIDSVRLAPGSSGFQSGLNFYNVDAGAGVVVIGMASVGYAGVSGADRFAELFLSVPASGSDRDITLSWVVKSPVQAPTPDNSLYPMIVGYCGGFAKVPQLYPHCCVVAGDADGNGITNIADAVYVLMRLFTEWPWDCYDRADANGDDMVNITDVVYVVQYIFAGGPPPACGASGVSP